VRLSRGPGRDDKTHWYVSGSIPMDRAHELSHALGLRDEYIDASVPRRRNAAAPGVFDDHSLLGNYYNEGVAQAEVKLRHAQQLAADISRPPADISPPLQRQLPGRPARAPARHPRCGGTRKHGADARRSGSALDRAGPADPDAERRRNTLSRSRERAGVLDNAWPPAIPHPLDKDEPVCLDRRHGRFRLADGPRPPTQRG